MRYAAIAILLLAVGCVRINPDDNPGGVVGFDAGEGTLTPTEQTTVQQGFEGSNAVQQLAVLAGSLFDVSPPIDPSKTALENARAIYEHIRENLGSTDGGVGPDGGNLACGSVSLDSTLITMDFGAAPGCTLKNGVEVSGVIEVRVTRADSTITLTLRLRGGGGGERRCGLGRPLLRWLDERRDHLRNQGRH